MQPALTICERTGKWAIAWRRAARSPDAQLPLHEVRSLPECRQAVLEAQAGFVLLELTGKNLAELLEFLAWLQFNLPAVRAAVLADRGLDDYELIARELGAIHFVDSPRNLVPLVGVVQRFFAGQQPSHPKENLREEIWQRLPWKPAAAGRDAGAIPIENMPTKNRGEK